MTNKVLGAFSAVALVALLAAPLAAESMRLTANVPFEFTMAGKTMPAGEYTVVNAAGSSALSFQNYEAKTAAAVLANAGPWSLSSTGDAMLVFNRYGSQYFLSEVHGGSSAATMTVPASRSERELAKTASAQTYEVLAVLARR